jgi:hypothetical protein
MLTRVGALSLPAGSHDLSALVEIDRRLSVNGSHVFPNLVRVGSILASGDSLELPALTTVESASSGNGRLTSSVRYLYAPLLRSTANTRFELYEGDLTPGLPIEEASYIRYSGRAPVFELPNLTRVAENLMITETRETGRVSFPVLDSVGVLQLINNYFSANQCTHTLLAEIDAPSLAEITGLTGRDALYVTANPALPLSEVTNIRDQVLARRGIGGPINIDDDFHAATCPAITIVSPTPSAVVSRSSTTFNMAVTIAGVVSSSDVFGRVSGSYFMLDDSDGDGVHEASLPVPSVDGTAEVAVQYRLRSNRSQDWPWASVEIEVVP